MAPPKRFSAEQIKDRRRLREKERREKRRNDPKLREEDRQREKLHHLNKKLKGQIKPIAELSAREQRAQRKKWRKRSKKSYYKKKSCNGEASTPITPNNPNFLTSSDPSTSHSRVEAGRKKKMRNRSKTYRDKLAAEKREKEAKRSSQKYRMRWIRLRNKIAGTPSPGTKAKRLLTNRTPEGRELVRRALEFGVVMEDQVKPEVRRLPTRDKKTFFRLIGSRSVRQLAKLTERGEYFSYKMYKACVLGHASLKNLKRKSVQVQKEVGEFLDTDENSRLTPGKRDFVIVKRHKYQKRYLNDTLKNLWVNFNSKRQKKISYTTFCRFKPVHVVHGKADERDTCLCLPHANFALLSKALKRYKVIENVSTDLIRSLCCEPLTTECLNRSCYSCKSKTMKIVPFDGAAEAKYRRWTYIMEERTIKGKQKFVKRLLKTEKTCSLKEATLLLINELPAFMDHVYRMKHQSNALSMLKVRENELVLHVDFSENYACKYAEEPQSVHFGASRLQLSLHTSVAYFNGEVISFCTVSENLRHDAKAIWAHLIPVLDHLRNRFPDFDTIHFISDGPTTQYRNRTMFSIFGKVLPRKYHNIKKCSWNFSEAGHGKGAVDGVGGTIKRIADRVVAEGNDVNDLNSFLEAIQKAVRKVVIALVSSEGMEIVDAEVPSSILIPTVKNTMKVHQITWCSMQRSLQFNMLTCLTCPLGGLCKHYAVSGPVLLVDDLPEDANGSVILEENLVSQPSFPAEAEEGKWVVAVFEDQWYPGIVEAIGPDKSATINFMARAGKNQVVSLAPTPRPTSYSTRRNLIQDEDAPCIYHHPSLENRRVQIHRIFEK